MASVSVCPTFSSSEVVTLEDKRECRGLGLCGVCVGLPAGFRISSSGCAISVYKILHPASSPRDQFEHKLYFIRIYYRLLLKRITKRVREKGKGSIGERNVFRCIFCTVGDAAHSLHLKEIIEKDSWHCSQMPKSLTSKTKYIKFTGQFFMTSVSLRYIPKDALIEFFKLSSLYFRSQSLESLFKNSFLLSEKTAHFCVSALFVCLSL